MTRRSPATPPAGSPPPIPWARPRLFGDEARLLEEALRSTWISGGPFVDAFESRVAGLCGSEHAVSASNGTAALHMAYLALGIGPGDEVVVPGFAFMAAANVALHVGARPVFADVDPATWCVTPASIETRLSPRTRLIVPVHTYGNVCDMNPIMELGRRRGIPVLEDAAEAFASRYAGRAAGAIAPLGAFSFQATKTITTGEGGMVLAAEAAMASRMRLFRSHGMAGERYRHEVAGHNFRLTNLQAALGCAQLDRLDVILPERARVHRRYREHLGGEPDVVLQECTPGVEPALWAMAVRLEEAAWPQGRDAVIAALAARGIETRRGFVAAGMMPLYDAPDLPVSDRLARQVISLPTFPDLSDDEIDRVCAELRSLST